MNQGLIFDWLLCATAFAVFALVPADPFLLVVKCIVAGLLIALAIGPI